MELKVHPFTFLSHRAESRCHYPQDYKVLDFARNDSSKDFLDSLIRRGAYSQV